MEEIIELNELNNKLKCALIDYRKYGADYAKYYTEYRIKLSKKLLELRADGMPATIAYDIARGDMEVATAKQSEIISECLYKNCQEVINTYKLRIRVLQAQINSEYKNGGN